MHNKFETGDKVKVFSQYTDQYHSGYTVILHLKNLDCVVVSHSDDNKPHAVSRHRVIIDDSPDDRKPYEDYPHGGAEGFAADMAILERAGALAKDATQGEWEIEYNKGIVVNRYFMTPSTSNSPSEGDLEVVAQVLFLDGDDIMYNSEADELVIVNAARVATALSRMLPYLKRKGVL